MRQSAYRLLGERTLIVFAGLSAFLFGVLVSGSSLWVSIALLVGLIAAAAAIVTHHRGSFVDELRFRQMFEQSIIGTAVFSLDGKILWMSAAYSRILGYTPEELIGRRTDELTYPEDMNSGREEIKNAIQGLSEGYRFTKRFLKRNGEPVWVEITGTVMRDRKSGQPTCFMSQATDITIRQSDSETLRTLERRWDFALESAGQGVWDANLETGYCYYSPVWKRMLGYSDDEIANSWNSWYNLIHPDDRERAVKSGNDHLAGLTPIAEGRFRLRHKDGRWIWMLDRGRVFDWDAQGRPRRMIGAQTDITAQVAMSEALADEKELLRITLRSIAEAVICTDINGNINFINPAAETLTGRVTSEVTGQHVQTVFQPIHEETRERLNDLSATAIREGQTCERPAPAIFTRLDGTERAVHELASPLVNSDGEIIGSVLVIQDVTASQSVQRDLAYAATHDALTKLCNRDYFDRQLAVAARTADLRNPISVLYIDLDRFKIVNDVSGHTAGDALLREVSDIISRDVPDGSLVARLGGDEFGIILQADASGAEQVAGKIIENISAIRFFWKGTKHDIGASIGIALVDTGFVSTEIIMAQADVACYAAKAAGRRRLSVYRPEDGEAYHHLTELKAATGIKSAIDENRLLLFAQEIRNLEEPFQPGRKLEILARMQASDGSIIAPGGFIPTAERFELINAIDRWVLSRTFRYYGSRIMAIPELKVAINLSAATLSDPTMIEFLTHELNDTDFSPQRLIFEITETAMINNFSAADRFLAEARRIGCSVSLDDFGSGVSSFSYLKRFQVDTIKIDGGFVKNVARSSYDRAIVNMINELARGISVATVAEYVEDIETLAVLKEIGVREGQGYLFHRPAPLEDILNERLGELGEKDQATACPSSPNLNRRLGISG